MARKTVVDWANELMAANKEAAILEEQIKRDRAAVARGEANLKKWRETVEALKVEVAIAAGIVPDRPRPDDSSPMTDAEKDHVRSLIESTERVLAEPDDEPAPKAKAR